jgi:hypothetical protein
MDIGAAGIVSTVASSSTGYLSIYSPIFLLIGGLVLAFGVIFMLVGVVGMRSGGTGESIEAMDMDDAMEI